MASYLILGAGKFGRLALQRLASQDAEAAFWVVDRDAGALAAARKAARRPVRTGHPVHLIEQDAVAYLHDQLEEGGWNWLIPMVPLHVAFWYAASSPGMREAWEPEAVPESLGQGLSLAGHGRQGELLLSRAEHRCPDDCVPGPVCPVSGKTWEIPLDEQLAGLNFEGYDLMVVSSRQLAPGVGGYSPGELQGLLPRLAEIPGKALIATACRCHGVIHGLARRTLGRVA
jgi:hypothetical protein